MPSDYVPLREALAVACPLCHAKPGDKCINIVGGREFTGFTHRERRQAVRDGV